MASSGRGTEHNAADYGLTVGPQDRRGPRLALVSGVMAATLALVVWTSASPRSPTMSLAAIVGTTSTTDVSMTPVPTTAPTSTAVAPTSSTTATAPTTTTATTVVPATISRATLCEAARSSIDRLRRLSVSMTDPQKARGLVQDAPALAQLVKAAPPEVQHDLAALVSAMDASRAGLEAAGSDPAKLPPDAVMRATSPEVAMAIGRIEVWAKTAC